jgi:hypothetical protein
LRSDQRGQAAGGWLYWPETIPSFTNYSILGDVKSASRREVN